MPVTYAGRIYYTSESPLGVVFARGSTRVDGSPGATQWYDHAGGGWDNEYDDAKHLRRLDAASDDKADQSFAVPDDVVDDPSARARVYVLNSGAARLSLLDQPSANHLHALTRRWSSKP